MHIVVSVEVGKIMVILQEKFSIFVFCLLKVGGALLETGTQVLSDREPLWLHFLPNNICLLNRQQHVQLPHYL